MSQNIKTLLIAFVGLALLGGMLQWFTGSASGWLALGFVALTFGILWRAGAFHERR